MESKRDQPWWQLLSIQTASSICLPNILVGHFLNHSFGHISALFAIIIGNIFLLILGYFFGVMGARSHHSTIQHIGHYFGKPGNLFFSIFMTLFMLFWFGIQLNVMSFSLQKIQSIYAPAFSPVFYHIGIGSLLTFLMCLGMRTIKFLSYLIAPFLVLAMTYAIFSTTGSIPLENNVPLTMIGGISLTIGANIGGAIDLPTFFRYARSEKDAKTCIFLLYFLVMPLTQLTGAYLSAISGNKSILDFIGLEATIPWKISFYSFSLISGWCTNNGNLYSAFVSSTSIPIKSSTSIRMFALGILGICISCLNLFEELEKVLTYMSIGVGAVGGVVLSNYLLKIKKGNFQSAFFSWLTGVSISTASLLFHFFITGAVILDACLISFFIQSILIQKIKKTKKIQHS